MKRTKHSYARQQVFERDRGVCAICGTKTIDVLSRINILRNRGMDNTIMAEMLEMPIGKLHDGILWEMDHILPVSEGGGNCDLDNLRTLCVWCHREETKDLKRRLSKTPKKVLWQKQMKAYQAKSNL